MVQSKLTQFERIGRDEPPYPIPFPDGTKEANARFQHRKWYWTVHDYDKYQCPDCKRGVEEVWGFDVHHIDRNPLNGAPGNLIGLCRRCHAWRHSDEKSLSLLTNREWKYEFENIADSEFLR